MSLKNCEKLENSYYKLTIEVGADKLNEACAEAYKKQAKKLAVPGFRKGKAPRSIIEKMYGKNFFYEDAVNLSYGDELDAAIQESGINVASQRIKVEMIDINDEGYSFTAVVPVQPDVKIENYKGIEAEKLIAKVDDSQIDAELERARKRGASITVIDDRAAENGDEATFDFKGFVDGVAFEGGEAEDYNLVLGSGQFIPGFEEQMIGHNVGEQFDVNVTFPEEYHAENLKGKEAVFKINLKGLKREELPEINDDLAADNGFDTLDEYKESIKKDLLKKAEDAADSQFDNKLMTALADLIDADIPDEMYDDMADQELEQWAYRLSTQGLSLDDYIKYTGMDIDSLRSQFRPQAVMQVKVKLALEKIVELENLEASEEEIAEQYKTLAERYERTEDEIKKLIPEDGIKHDIVVEKAMKLVHDNAKANLVEKLSHDDDCDCDECHHDHDDAE